MAGSRRGRKLRVRKTISATAVPEADLVAARELIAKLIARAFANDNPHFFGSQNDDSPDQTCAGPSPATEIDSPTTQAHGARGDS